jgi:hypothetical protein
LGIDFIKDLLVDRLLALLKVHAADSEVEGEIVDLISAIVSTVAQKIRSDSPALLRDIIASLKPILENIAQHSKKAEFVL